MFALKHTLLADKHLPDAVVRLSSLPPSLPPDRPGGVPGVQSGLKEHGRVSVVTSCR